MSITQKFYDDLAVHYSKLFQDWLETTQEQGAFFDRLFAEHGYDKNANILDCACGIGTQAMGLAALGYNVSASDVSGKAVLEAKWEAIRRNLKVRFEYGDFCKLSERFKEKFDIIICIDNALPHMASKEALEAAIKSITGRLDDGGMFVASIRDYDELLKTKPPYSPPHIHKTEKGQRVSFQTWEWEGETYKLVQYIIEDEGNEGSLEVNKFECEYRAVRRKELTELLLANGCRDVQWKFPEESGFYQLIVIAKK